MSNSPQYRAFQALYDLLVNGVNFDVETVATKAFARKLISSPSLHNASNPQQDATHRANRLLQEILTKVEQNPSLFNTFVDILDSIPSLKELSSRLASQVFAEPSPSIDLQDNASSGECIQELKTKKKSIDSVGAASSDVATTTPEGDPDSVARGDDVPVDINPPDLTIVESVSVTIESLKNRFEEIVVEAVTYFASQEAIDPGFLASFRRRVALLSGLKKLLPSTFSTKCILEAESVDWLFTMFNEFWDYMNCSLLEKIIKKLGSSTLKNQMASYTRDLQKFCSMTNVFHFPAWEFNIPPDFSTIVAKLKINAQECTIAHLLEYRQKIADCSVLQPPDIRLAGTVPGSVIMTLALPRILTTLFVKSFDWNNKSAEDIEELRVDDLQLVEYQHLLKCPIPLIEAAKQGFTEVTKTLLANKSDVNIQDEDGATPLSWAVANGHLSTSQLLVEAGADVTIQNNSGATPLWRACYYGYTAIAALLIDHGANVNRPRASDVGNPPLVQTSANGHLDTVKLLIDRGAHVNGQNKNGNTPLILASQEGHKDIVEVLLNHGAEVDLPNKKGDTPLSLAVDNGHLSTSQLLVEAGADVTIPDSSGATPLWSACHFGYTAIAALLIDHGANVNRPRADDVGNPPLIAPSARGHLDTVKLLIDRGAHVNGQNKNGDTPLIAASDKGHKDIVEVLLKHGAEVDLPNKNGKTPLWSASYYGRTDVARLLIDRGANVNQQTTTESGNYPLTDASGNGHVDTVKLLIDRGAKVNAQNTNGDTPLQFASQYGHKDIVEVLLYRGAEVDLPDKNGDTPLQLASQEGHKDIVEVLLNHGAEVDLPNKNGCTPLWAASADGRTDVARLLIDRGANINQQTTEETGNYPLTDASANGHVDTVKLLIDRGAKVNAQNKEGATPLQFASQEGHKDIVEVLLNHGAEVDLSNKLGMNAVMGAILRQHTEIALMLLQAPHINVNTQDKNGLTALIMAARDGNIEIVRALLGINGVAVNIQEGTAGWSALFFACERGHLEIVNLLLNAGADTTLRGKSGDTALDVAMVHKREEVVATLEQHASKKTPSPTTSLRASGETESKQEPTQEEEDEKKKKEEHGRQSSEGDKDNQPLEHTPTDEGVESVGVHPPPDSDKTRTPPSDKLGGHSEKSTSTPETPTTSRTTLSRLERMRQRILKTSKQITEVFARVIQETALRQQAEKRKFLESNKRASERESQQGVELEYLPEVIEPPQY